MSKSFISGLIIGVILFLVAGVGAFRQQSQVINSPDADATPVQLGVMTDQQRAHSKLYESYKKTNHGRTIREILAMQPGNIVIGINACRLSEDPTITLEMFYRQLLLNSGTVIRGIVKEKTSQVTEDEGFIFTDYKIIVSEVLKDNILSPITTDNTIIVTQPGGKVIINGRQIKAVDGAYKPLKINSQVVLFLKYIPEAGTYALKDPKGSFELINSMAQPLTGLSLPQAIYDQKADAFLNIVRSISKD